MATQQPVSENPEVAHHYATQVALAAALAAALRGNSPGNLHTASAFKHFALIAASLTQRYSEASISLAADHYDVMREQAEVPGAFRVPINDPWDAQAIEAYLHAATEQIRAQASVEAQAILEQAESAAQQIALDAGRNQVLTAVSADPQRVRWARVTRPGACSFCLMQAIRGAVYRTDRTADFRAHTKFDGRGGDCRCGVEPVFGGDFKPAPHVAAAQSLYAEATDGVRGSAKQRNAFRRALYAQRSSTR